MPLYEYACEECNHLVEVLVRGNERPACPDCGGSKLQKQLSVISAHISGSQPEMPACQPPGPGGCGLPQCGTGGCQFG